LKLDGWLAHYVDEVTQQKVRLNGTPIFRVCNFLSHKRGRLIAATHGGLRIALQKAYPEVDFKEWKYLLGEIGSTII